MCPFGTILTARVSEILVDRQVNLFLVVGPIDCTHFIFDCCFVHICIDELSMLLFSFIHCSLYLFRTPNELTMDALVCPPLHYMSPPRAYATALASMPGSGNTWLRHLLQEATRK